MKIIEIRPRPDIAWRNWVAIQVFYVEPCATQVISVDDSRPLESAVEMTIKHAMGGVEQEPEFLRERITQLFNVFKAIAENANYNADMFAYNPNEPINKDFIIIS